MEWLIAAGSVAAILASIAAMTSLLITMRERRLHCDVVVDRGSHLEQSTVHLDLRNGLRCGVNLLRVRVIAPRGACFQKATILDREWELFDRPLASGAQVSLPPLQLVGLPPGASTLVLDLRYERRSAHRRESQITARSRIPESPR